MEGKKEQREIKNEVGNVSCRGRVANHRSIRKAQSAARRAETSEPRRTATRFDHTHTIHVYTHHHFFFLFFFFLFVYRTNVQDIYINLVCMHVLFRLTNSDVSAWFLYNGARHDGKARACVRRIEHATNRPQLHNSLLYVHVYVRVHLYIVIENCGTKAWTTCDVCVRAALIQRGVGHCDA